MNFQGKAVLVYLEEDNIARAYFRVRPLMTQDGPVTSADTEFPDDGFLRIVPDKNEQHTFKERMRSLTGFCLVDLRFFALEANKIRTNKNYSPSRGETNQYIVYSDAVRSLPDDILYQVVSENDVNNAVTPLVYIRNGANIQGPFRREDGQSAGETAQLPPDSCEMHAAQINGQELLFYWPRKDAEAPEKPLPAEQAVPAPAPAAAEPAPEEKVESSAAEKPVDAPVRPSAFEQIQSLNEPLSKNANRLQAPSAPMPEIPAAETAARPFAGTRLYQAPQRQTAPRRAHNPLMEAVENQRYAARYEPRYEAPGATLPQNAELREVANPAEALKRALQGMSHSPEAQRQAADVILSESGMRIMLSKALVQEANNLTLVAMHTQLQELEAERLMTLMQLDDAKKSLAAAREAALGTLNMAEQKKLDQLHIAQQTAQNSLNQVTKAMDALEKKRQEAAAFLAAAGEGALQGADRLLCPPAGGCVSREELIGRVEACLKAAGFLTEEGDALAMLTAFALSAGTNEWQIRSEATDDAEYALRAFAAALGTEVVFLRKRNRAAVLSGGSAPLFVSAFYSKPVVHPLVFHTTCDRLGCKDDGGWYPAVASVPVYPDPAVLPGALPEYAPVALECVVREMLPNGEALNGETKAVIASVRKAIADAGYPLPLAAVESICRFISATQNAFRGGVAEAIDRAFCLWAVPHILCQGLDTEALKPQLASMPRTLKALKA